MHYLDALSFINKEARGNTLAKIGEEMFHFTFMLFNRKNTRTLRWPAIRNLSLQDDVLNWYIEGSVDIVNSLNYLEHAKLPFEFIGGCNDYLFIELTPKGSAPEGLENVFTFKRLFSIHSTEDNLDTDDENERYKSLFFRDAVYNYLASTNIEWSTTDAIKRLYPGLSHKPVSQLGNNSRSLHTGDAIKDFLRVALEGDQKIGEFDKGSTTVFYNTPVGARGIDTLNYLLQRHTSTSTGEPCLLSLDRSIDHPAWTLSPLSNYFADAVIKVADDNNQPVHVTGLKSPERFTVSTSSNDLTTVSGDVVNMTPRSGPFELQLPGKDLITSLHLTIPSVDEQLSFMGPSPVHTYNKSTGQFNIHCYENHSIVYDEFFRQQFIGKMYTDSDTGGSRIFNYNTTTIDSMYSSDDDTAVQTGRNRALISEVLFANNIEFSVPGFLFRRSKSFVTLAPHPGARTNSVYGNILYGQWFVTNVVHTFSQDTYNNTVLATKPYKFK